jgi:hypothetical protein
VICTTRDGTEKKKTRIKINKQRQRSQDATPRQTHVEYFYVLALVAILCSKAEHVSDIHS